MIRSLPLLCPSTVLSLSQISKLTCLKCVLSIKNTYAPGTTSGAHKSPKVTERKLENSAVRRLKNFPRFVLIILIYWILLNIHSVKVTSTIDETQKKKKKRAIGYFNKRISINVKTDQTTIAHKTISSFCFSRIYKTYYFHETGKTIDFPVQTGRRIARYVVTKIWSWTMVTRLPAVKILYKQKY